MTLKTELITGVALWAIGMAVMVGVALATPRYEFEGHMAGGALAILGFFLVATASWTIFGDAWEEEINDTYKQEKKDGR